ncbi:MAG TPA: acetyl-CoA C-acyltransferase [Candidatus Obscuribacterales bacterium]
MLQLNAYIIDGVFTPRASVRKGASAYTPVHPQELAATCFRTLRQRQPEVFPQTCAALLGCVSQVNDQGANLARNAVLSAGMPESVSAASLNMCCGSGLETVNLAAGLVTTGSERLVLAGGVESMSRVKMASDGGGMDGNNLTLRHQLLQVPQGISADYIATTDGISRRELEEFALHSHKKAAAAGDANYFDNAFALVKDGNGKPLLTAEDHIRPDASLAALQQLAPAFEKLEAELRTQGVIGPGTPLAEVHALHTAGTSSGIADGAGALLIANDELIKEFKAKPRARIRGFRSRGSDPISMLTGPADCCNELLKSCGMTVNDVDLWEINEAFAVVPLQTVNRLGISMDRVNIKGGAISRGHPLGATGAILLIELVNELEKEDKSIGVAVLCVAGGQSVATLVQRCSY